MDKLDVTGIMQREIFMILQKFRRTISNESLFINRMVEH